MIDQPKPRDQATRLPSMEGDTGTQLALLREIRALFGAAHIPVWLRGGWALDFHQGTVTRSHSDIDLVTWKHNAPRLRRRLVENGFAFRRDTGLQMDFVKHQQDVSLVFVARDERGQIYTPDRPDWVWLSGCLAGPPRRLADLHFCLLSLEALLDEKRRYQEGTGRPLRPKDLNSIAVLERLLREARN